MANAFSVSAMWRSRRFHEEVPPLYSVRKYSSAFFTTREFWRAENSSSSGDAPARCCSSRSWASASSAHESGFVERGGASIGLRIVTEAFRAAVALTRTPRGLGINLVEIPDNFGGRGEQAVHVHPVEPDAGRAGGNRNVVRA